jgi:hypothetical protein
MSRDEAARIADESLRAFIESMAAAGNPGAGRHEIGMHHVHGWILEYDGTIGGSPIQAVIGVDGVIHVLREARGLLTYKWSASEWVLLHEASLDPVASATRFADHLSQILAFDHVGVEVRDDEPPPWGPFPDS